MASSGRDNARLLFWIGLAGAVLFIVAVFVAFLATAFAPLLGLSAGNLDPTVVGLMLTWALIALGLLPASRWLSHREKNGNGEP